VDEVHRDGHFERPRLRLIVDEVGWWLFAIQARVLRDENSAQMVRFAPKWMQTMSWKKSRGRRE
jgi:hypothetical protein